MTESVSNLLKIAGNIVLSYKRTENGMYKFYSPEEKDRWFTIHPKSKIQWFYSDSYKDKNMKDLKSGQGNIKDLEAGFDADSKVVGVFRSMTKGLSADGAQTFAKQLLLTRATTDKYSEKKYKNGENYNKYLKKSLLKNMKPNHYDDQNDYEKISESVKGASTNHIGAMIKEISASPQKKSNGKSSGGKPMSGKHAKFGADEYKYRFNKDGKYSQQLKSMKSAMTNSDGLSAEDQDAIFKGMLYEKKHNIGQKGWGRNQEQIKQAFLKHINPANFSSPEAYKSAIERLKKMPAEAICGLIHEISEEEEGI